VNAYTPHSHVVSLIQCVAVLQEDHVSHESSLKGVRDTTCDLIHSHSHVVTLTRHHLSLSLTAPQFALSQADLVSHESSLKGLQCVAVCCSVLQCVAARCSVLQCVAVCCSLSRMSSLVT